MIKNYIKLAWRNLKKNRLFSVISLSGLILGLLACLSVISVVLDDFSYDTHWSRKNDIYRLLTKTNMGDGVYDKMSASWAGMRPALMDNFPEVEAVTSINIPNYHIKKTLSEDVVIDFNAIQTDTLIWELFDFKILSGNPKQFVYGKSNLVLTKSLKDKLFPDEDVIGKTVYSIPSFSNKPSPFLITGIIDDIPNNTHLRAQALVINKGRLEALNKKQYGTFMYNYVLFKSGTDINEFTDKINTWYSDFIEGETKYSYEFQLIEDTYLNSEFDVAINTKGNRSTNYILLGVALLVLLIACVNFINLSVARSLSRVKEIGVRKVIGSNRKQIIFQFLAESLLYYVIALIVALSAFYFVRPLIEQFIGHPLQLSLLSNVKYISLVLLAVFIISAFTGIYPALLISGFKPINSLKGQILKHQVNGQQTVQKGLVVVQFSIAIIVLVSVLVVQSQLNFVNNKDLGYNKDNLIAINPASWNGKGQIFHQKITNLSEVTSASFTRWRPTQGSGNMSKPVDNPSKPGTTIDVNFITGDVYLPETIGLELISGRFFDENLKTDAPKSQVYFSLDNDEEEKPNTQPSLLTEYTAGILGITEMNKTMTKIETNPVGIIKNFHTESLRENLKPVVVIAESDIDYSSLLIRLKEGANTNIMNKINEIWSELFPNKYLAMNWVDDLVKEQYIEEKKLQTFFTFFSTLTLLLSIMGVFGLVVQSTEQRIKEIGVRKVLGASIGSIAILFSKTYAKLVLVAIVFALPIAWYATSEWLQDFAYHITIEWTVLVLAALLVLTIALATVIIQSIRAAIANPIKSLRTE